MNKSYIIYLLIVIIILLYIVLVNIKIERFDNKSKCYKCENNNCNIEYPGKCYDCYNKSSALNYVLGMPGGNPKLFTGM